MMVFSGFIVDLTTVFQWLSWIQWISAFRYASNVLTINEFRHLLLCETINGTNICSFAGEKVLDQKNLAHANDWDMWKYFAALAGMATFFLILSYIQLARMKKTK
jgi:ATP-binding cassette subfamily G (WHITE) protein 2